MIIAVMDARTRFLVSAAHTYATAAPAIAAHLKLSCNELFATDEAGKHTQQIKGACSACGTILIPGFNSRITVVKPQAKIPRQRLSRPAAGNGRNRRIGPKPQTLPKLLRNECTACGRYTETALAKHEHTKASVQHKESPAAVQVLGSQVTSSVTTGYKRPRSRRQGGLKALLAGAKETARPSSSLDLMDFMKSA